MTLLYFIISKMTQILIKFNGGKICCSMSRDKLKEVYLNLELVGEVAFGFSIGFEKEISIKPV